MAKEQKWKECMAFMTPNYVEAKVNNQNLKFWPVSVGLIFKLRSVARPLLTAIAMLTQENANDVKKIERMVRTPDGKGFDSEIVVEAISPELAKYREGKREFLIGDTIEKLLADDNKEVLGEIIMDALHEVFPRDPLSRKFKDDVQPREFIESITFQQLVQLLTGVASANQEIFGPLAQTVQEIFASAGSNLAPNQKQEVPPVSENKTEQQSS